MWLRTKNKEVKRFIMGWQGGWSYLIPRRGHRMIVLLKIREVKRSEEMSDGIGKQNDECNSYLM